MKSATIALMMLLCLAACSAARYEANNVKAAALSCPDLMNYTATRQQEMLAELQCFPVPELKEAMKDFKTMRDQTRVCRGMKIPGAAYRPFSQKKQPIQMSCDRFYKQAVTPVPSGMSPTISTAAASSGDPLPTAKK